jgi:hypothetical protein
MYDSDEDEGNGTRGKKMGFFARLMCAHEWRPYGSAYDSTVKCTKCEDVRDEQPGDYCAW